MKTADAILKYFGLSSIAFLYALLLAIRLGANLKIYAALFDRWHVVLLIPIGVIFALCGFFQRGPSGVQMNAFGILQSFGLFCLIAGTLLIFTFTAVDSVDFIVDLSRICYHTCYGLLGLFCIAFFVFTKDD